jgi:3',5'-cyclic AMP phosphodiesterase CpdA
MTTNRRWARAALAALAALAAVAAVAAVAAIALPAAVVAQAKPAPPSPPPAPILAARNPLPSEAVSERTTKFSFIAYGDTRGRHDGVQLQSEHQLVIEQMLRTIKSMEGGPDPVRFVLQSGDAVVNGRDANALTVSYIPLINRITQDAGIPYYFSAGNHDVNGATDKSDVRWMEGMRNLFAANANFIPPIGSPRRLDGYATYGFGFGNTFVIAFDSNIADDETQFRWVKRQLEGLDRARYVNVVAFYHHPAFSSGPHGHARPERQAVAIRAKYHPLFRQHHVKLLLTGHEHLFEHWVERYTDASGPHRMDEIVSGGGGAPLYGYAGEPDLSDYLKANAADEVTIEHLAKPSIDPGGNPFHFVVVHVDGGNLRVDVVGVDWGRGFAPYKSAKVGLTDSK